MYIYLFFQIVSLTLIMLKINENEQQKIPLRSSGCEVVPICYTRCDSAHVFL